MEERKRKDSYSQDHPGGKDEAKGDDLDGDVDP